MTISSKALTCPMYVKYILAFALIICLLRQVIWYKTAMPARPVICSCSNFTKVDPYLVLPDRGPNLKLLPNLSSISWPYPIRPNFTRKATGSVFNLKLSEGQYNSLKRLLEAFELVMISLKLQDQWFLTAGSLMGSLRHHDMIPWDDDIDVCANAQHRGRIQSALKNLPAEFATASQFDRDKLFFKPLDENVDVNSSTIGSFRIPGLKWSWPYLDIFYFKRIGPETAKELTWRSSLLDLKKIFPVTYRPLGKHWYPAPRNPMQILQIYYLDNNVCISSYYSHALEHRINSQTVRCEALLSKHPFVKPCPLSDYSGGNGDLQICDEYLVDGNGKKFHKIRTLLPPNEIVSSKFTAHNDKFSCP